SAEGAVELRGGVHEVFLQPDPGEGANLVEEVPHAAAAAPAEEAEGAAAGLAHIVCRLYVALGLLRLHRELVSTGIGRLGPLRAERDEFLVRQANRTQPAPGQFFQRANNLG